MPSPAPPVRSDIRVGLVFLRGGTTLLLARPAGTGPYELAGGPVPPAAGVDAVVRAQVATLAQPPVNTRFLGCVEQVGDGPAPAHALQVVFAVELAAAADPPPGLVEVAIADLPGVDLRPRALSSVLQRWLPERRAVWHGAPRRDAAARRGGMRDSLRAQLFAVRTELRSGSFRDASVAMLALVAAADGRIDPAERAMLIDYVTTDDVLSHFPADELTGQFEEHLDRLQRDFGAGKAAALKEIAKVRRREVEARAVIQTGIVMGCSDGWFDDTEKAVVREAIRVLELDLADFPIDEIRAVPAPGVPPAEHPTDQNPAAENPAPRNLGVGRD